MNISAINASASLGRRQVPRNNVSFGKKIDIHNVASKNVVTKNAAKLGQNIKNAALFVGKKVSSGAKKAVGGIKKTFANIKNVAKDNKGVKGIKIAATALTAIVAGAFATKEIHDIATKTNPER